MRTSRCSTIHAVPACCQYSRSSLRSRTSILPREPLVLNKNPKLLLLHNGDENLFEHLLLPLQVDVDVLLALVKLAVHLLLDLTETENGVEIRDGLNFGLGETDWIKESFADDGLG